MKMPRKKSSKNGSKSTSRSSISVVNRCAFETSDGRRCRMPRFKDHPSLCPFHAREERQLLEAERLGAQLAASLTGDFMTATDINFVLGKLFTAVAQRRIPTREAATLAYIAQLMLHTLPKLKQEYAFKYSYEGWKEMREEAIRLSPNSPMGTDNGSGNDSDADETAPEESGNESDSTES